MEQIQWTLNHLARTHDTYSSRMSPETLQKALAFHRSFPGYRPTPLARLSRQAGRLGLGGIYVKDESYRFGLNAFKVLGSSYAIACSIAERTGRPLEKLGFSALTSPELRRETGELTFITATDGNHGRGVAWAARQLGQKAVVHMPRGTTAARVENIRREGAQVTVEELPYDDCVRLAAREAAADPHAILMQDTAWAGYEEIPCRIMEGYGTMIAEAMAQLPAPPTHIFIQAGVGSLAAAVAAAFCGGTGSSPRVILLEAQAADCFFQSARAGRVIPSQGDLSTIMAGLACGEPSTVAWDILQNHAFAFLSCPDWVSARGMRMLSAPMKGDPQVVSGESGAVGMGALSAIMEEKSGAPLREALGLGPDSQVLLFSTEGDTDPDRYRAIVWEGAYPSR